MSVEEKKCNDILEIVQRRQTAHQQCAPDVKVVRVQRACLLAQPMPKTNTQNPGLTIYRCIIIDDIRYAILYNIISQILSKVSSWARLLAFRWN